MYVRSNLLSTIVYLYSMLLRGRSDELKNMSGIIESPNFPQSYPDNLNKTWAIEHNAGYVIHLYFTEFDLESSFDNLTSISPEACVYDYLEILEAGKTLRKFCGNWKLHPLDAPKLLEVVRSSGHSLILRLISDFSNVHRYRGFKAHYKQIDRNECTELVRKTNSWIENWDSMLYCNHFCHNVPGGYYCSCDIGFTLHKNNHTCIRDCVGKILTDPNGTISTSRHPHKYSKLADCDWTIKTSEGLQVEIKFVGEFEIERHQQENCAYDWVEYGNGIETGTTPTHHCGLTKPGNGEWISFKSNVMKIAFHSDLSVEYAGFKIEYKTTKIECGQPDKVTHGEISIALKEKYFFGDVVTYKCVTGYRLVGKIEIMCDSSGEWSPKPPVCEMKTCLEPIFLQNVSNGKIKDEIITLTYGTTLTFLCYVWYEMTSGVSVWRCEDDEKWHEFSEPVASEEGSSRNLPICEPICGLKGNKAVLNSTYNFGDVIHTEEDPEPYLGQQITGGRPTKRGEWPWMAFIDLVGESLALAGNICGGSLISHNSVLTAAHCLYNFGWTNKANLVVYIGITDRSDPEEKAQVFRVKEYFTDGFDPDSMDRDIAVLRLDASVKIGKYARPICLPRSHREIMLPIYALNKVPDFQKKGIIAGWGYTTDSEHELPHKLMMARVAPSSSEHCNTLIPFERGLVVTSNMFCAGSIFKNKDSCHGDSGGPIMFKDRGRYFVNGVVSFGTTKDCGVGVLGVYANVSRLIQIVDNALSDS